MFIAIDIDGTITSNPVAYKNLMRSLYCCDGQSVHILTGSLDMQTPYDQLRIGRVEQLRNMDIVFGIDYDDVHVMVGRDLQEVADKKGIFCRDNGVELFIDDSPLYLQACAKYSPLTVRVSPHIM